VVRLLLAVVVVLLLLKAVVVVVVVVVLLLLLLLLQAVAMPLVVVLQRPLLQALLVAAKAQLTRRLVETQEKEQLLWVLEAPCFPQVAQPLPAELPVHSAPLDSAAARA